MTRPKHALVTHDFKPRIQDREDEDNESTRSDDAQPQLRASE